MMKSGPGGSGTNQGQAILEAAMAILILSVVAGAGTQLIRGMWKRTRCDHLEFRKAIREASTTTPGFSSECPTKESQIRLRPLDEIDIKEFP